MAVPCRDEQKKIADFLKTIDHKVELLRRKHALITEYKRGVMQLLFSQRLRFRRDDGSAFPDWENRPFGEDLIEYKERVPADTTLPVYSSSREGLQQQREYFADREVANDGQYGVVPNGYITYRHMSDDLTFKFNLNTTGGSIAVSKEYPVFTCRNGSPKYLVEWLNASSEFAKFAVTQKTGGTRTRLYFAKLAKWVIALPSPDEQRKIADFLLALDEKISAVGVQITRTETLKKGLVQQMFA